MDSIKQRQVASLLHKNLGDIFIRDGANYYGRAFVTISGVKLTPDLQLARVHISVFNVPDKKAILTKIEQNLFYIKKTLYAGIRNQLRIMPEIEFYLDETLDEVQKMEEVFKKIKVEDEPTDTDQ